MLDQSPSSRAKVDIFLSYNNRLHSKSLGRGRASWISHLDVGGPDVMVVKGIVVADRGIHNFLRLNADIEKHEAVRTYR